MAVSKAAHDSLNGVKPLNGRAGGGAALVNGFDVPSNLEEFVHSDKFLTLAVDPEGTITPEISMEKLRFHAMQMAPSSDGMRRSRVVWICVTKKRLKELEEAFLEAFPDSVPDHEIGRGGAFTVHFDSDVECEVLFRVHNKSEEASGIPQASFGIFDDFYETSEEFFGWVASRVGLYPNRRDSLGCVTDNGGNNRIIWGIVRSSWGSKFLDRLKAGLEDHVHITRLHLGSASEG